MSAAYEALIEEHRGSLERLARRLSRNRDDADDLLQESLLDAYRSFERFRPGSQFYNWFARIMTNNQLDRLRRTRETTVSLEGCGTDPESSPIEIPDHRSNPERVLLQEVLDQPFRRALDRLDRNQRVTVELCDLHGATYEEAAAATNCPIGTIRSRLHRAHKSMERSLLPFMPRLPLGGYQTRCPMGSGPSVASARAMIDELESPKFRVACSESTRVILMSDAVIPQDASELGDADVVVLTAEQDARMDQRQIEEIARRVREGMGLVLLHSGESRVLRTLFGVPSGWDEVSDTLEAGLEITAPRHPVARGVSTEALPRIRVAPGSFTGPRPDMVVLGSVPVHGASSWQGAAWTIGRGRVFCFRPSIETLAGSKPLAKLLSNAVAWAGA